MELKTESIVRNAHKKPAQRWGDQTGITIGTIQYKYKKTTKHFSMFRRIIPIPNLPIRVTPTTTWHHSDSWWCNEEDWRINEGFEVEGSIGCDLLRVRKRERPGARNDDGNKRRPRGYDHWFKHNKKSHTSYHISTRSTMPYVRWGR